MRISRFNTEQLFENQKLNFQRKKLQEAYKKTATFVDKSKNPTIKLIAELLQSSKNKSLDLPQHDPTNQTELESASSSDYNNETPFIENNRIENFEAANQFEIDNNPLIDNANEINGYLDEPFVFTDARFNIQETSIENRQRSLENIKQSLYYSDINLTRNTYEKAISHYTNHMKMAQAGYHITPSQYSWTA
ncbi:putative protein OS=Ureibacillus acetophenoni OX=614649 GN=SAMN05877842_10628 PE=4 SV=1 [Ureibacillus acetophenoni]